MTEKPLMHISDFEWASVAQYLVYVAGMAGLKELGSERVNSFRLSGRAVERTIALKKGTLVLLKENMRALERFVGAYEGEMSDGEKAVIREMYRQHASSVRTVERHLAIAKSFGKASQLGFVDCGGVDDDDSPF